MTALNFPNNPTDGQLYPIAPAANQIQYKYNSSKQAWLVNPATAITPVIVVTSESSNSINTGAAVFTFNSAAPVGFFVGQRLRAVHTLSNYMEGQITALTATELTLNIDYTKGTGGPYTAWTIGVTGDTPSDDFFLNETNLALILALTS